MDAPTARILKLDTIKTAIFQDLTSILRPTLYSSLQCTLFLQWYGNTYLYLSSIRVSDRTGNVITDYEWQEIFADI